MKHKCIAAIPVRMEMLARDATVISPRISQKNMRKRMIDACLLSNRAGEMTLLQARYQGLMTIFVHRSTGAAAPLHVRGPGEYPPELGWSLADDNFANCNSVISTLVFSGSCLLCPALKVNACPPSFSRQLWRHGIWSLAKLRALPKRREPEKTKLNRPVT